jgi:hypothetical protein
MSMSLPVTGGKVWTASDGTRLFAGELASPLNTTRRLLGGPLRTDMLRRKSRPRREARCRSP